MTLAISTQQSDKFPALYRQGQLFQRMGAAELAAHPIEPELSEFIFACGFPRSMLHGHLKSC